MGHRWLAHDHRASKWQCLVREYGAHVCCFHAHVYTDIHLHKFTSMQIHTCINIQMHTHTNTHIVGRRMFSKEWVAEAYDFFEIFILSLLICLVAPGSYCSSWTLQLWHGPSRPAACGILVPRPGIEPMSPALQGRISTTGPWGKSWGLWLLMRTRAWFPSPLNLFFFFFNYLFACARS